MLFIYGEMHEFILVQDLLNSLTSFSFSQYEIQFQWLCSISWGSLTAALDTFTQEAICDVRLNSCDVNGQQALIGDAQSNENSQDFYSEDDGHSCCLKVYQILIPPLTKWFYH